jgi:hypothetical protein
MRNSYAEETEHIVFRENPPLVNMDQDVVQSSASKENQVNGLSLLL